MTISCAVLGASGYAGGEVVRFLDDHPTFEIKFLGAHSQAGMPLGKVHPHLTQPDRMLLSADSMPDVDLVFLSLPHGASALLGGELSAAGKRVIDLGSDFRMDTADRYQAAYGSPHQNPNSLREWVYGLPELFGEQIKGANTVAAPGCYPTATLLALVPLLGLIDTDSVVVNALSGASGAGRSPKEELLFGAVDESVRAYGVGTHRHRPEIEMGIELASGIATDLVFTPHLVPMQRGILTTVTAPVQVDVAEADLRDTLTAFYLDAPFVSVLDQPPQTRWVVGSNRAMISVYLDSKAGSAIVLSAIDNLVKGAAGQAIQIANLMFGLDETAGLPLAGWMP